MATPDERVAAPAGPPALGYAPPARPRDVLAIGDGGARRGTVAVAEEVPVAFIYDGRPHVVVMASPADLEDLAVGFTLSERVVEAAREVERVQVVRYARGVEIQITIPAAAADRLTSRGGRALAARTGCGLCGVQAIDEVLRPLPPVASPLAIEPEALWRAGAALAEAQTLNHETRAVHAAAWAAPDGALRVVREDVGRHNALDKVIGALARAGLDAGEGFLIVTSRASYELVQKTAVAGAPLLAAVSRPTGLAIQLADATGITLVGLLRGRSANVYSHEGRLRIADRGPPPHRSGSSPPGGPPPL